MASSDYMLSIVDEGVEMSVACTKIGNNVYRLESIPFLTDAVARGDVFEADEKDGVLTLCGIIESGGQKTYRYVLSPRMREAHALEEVFEKVKRNGGEWEQAGGFLAISLPSGAEYDPGIDLDNQT